MLRITRIRNAVLLLVVEGGQAVKSQRFTYAGVPDAMAHAETAKSMSEKGQGYAAIANYLTYGGL